jgi:hypothetical protein
LISVLCLSEHLTTDDTRSVAEKLRAFYDIRGYIVYLPAQGLGIGDVQFGSGGKRRTEPTWIVFLRSRSGCWRRYTDRRPPRHNALSPI